MGVKGLYKLIQKYAPDAIKVVTMKDLADWRIAFDVSQLVYQMVSIGNSHSIKNKEGKLIHHIQGTFFRIASMILAGIEPVMIFDGAPPLLKEQVIKQRKQTRDAGNATRIPHGVFLEVMKLFDLMGVPWIQAPSEAEAQAASMTKSTLTQHNTTDAVASEDIDTIVFGAQYMIRGLDTAAHRIQLIETAKVLTGLKITQNQLIDLAILLGCDYTPSFANMGPVRAYKLILKYGTIENIIVGEKLINNGCNFIGVREIFKNPEVVPVNNINNQPLNIKDLNNFLITIHGLDEKRVNKTLNALAKHQL